MDRSRTLCGPAVLCPDYRKDHIEPLACGGPDAASNVQWQTVAEVRTKDAWERKGYGR